MKLKIDDQTLAVAERDYRKLSMETAQRTVRFWQLHNRIEKQPHLTARTDGARAVIDNGGHAELCPP